MSSTPHEDDHRPTILDKQIEDLLKMVVEQLLIDVQRNPECTQLSECARRWLTAVSRQLVRNAIASVHADMYDSMARIVMENERLQNEINRMRDSIRHNKSAESLRRTFH